MFRVTFTRAVIPLEYIARIPSIADVTLDIINFIIEQEREIFSNYFFSYLIYISHYSSLNVCILMDDKESEIFFVFC